MIDWQKKKKQKKRSKNIKGQSLIIAALNEKDLTEKLSKTGETKYMGEHAMNIAVCDDQPEVLDVVENMLREIPEVERVETYQDIRHMRDEFEDGKRPDVLIMDICHEYNTKIPETEERQEGIDYAYELNQKFPELQIIYLTGYTTRYSQHIFLKPVNLVGYLTKPVNADILEKLLKIAKERRVQEDEKRVTIMCRNQQQIFYLNEIWYLESSAHRTMIHTYENVQVCHDKISDMEERMGETFVRCHQSFLVNMKYIRRVEHDRFKLENGEEIPISKKRYMEARTRYFQYLEDAVS